MTVESVAEFYRDTRFGQKLRAEGRDKGLEEGREMLLSALLLDRFGERPELSSLARRLAQLPDPFQAVHAVTTATMIDELQHAVPLR